MRELEGAWLAPQGRLVLAAEGHCEWNGAPGTWQADAGTLGITIAGAASFRFAWRKEPAGLVLTAADGTTVTLGAEAPGMRTVIDPATGSSLTVPAGWTLVPGQNGAVRFARILPGYGPNDILEHEIILFQLPAPPPDVEIDQLFAGFVRGAERVVDAPHGRIARRDYTAAHARGFAAGVQRGGSYLFATVVSLPAVAGQLDEQVLAILDTAVVKTPDPALAAREIVGQWVVPSKTGASLEHYTFNADGTFAYHFEASHTGSSRSTHGDTTASWGTAAQEDDAGRWQITGETLKLTGRRGEQTHLFRIWREAGKQYLRVGSATFVR